MVAAHSRYAAAYARMSTDRQGLSIQQQMAAISAYAEANGLTIVRTYLDEGKSGLALAGRQGLRNMIADILGGEAGYCTVLVLDVSRWGRFQDADESAHYEWICRQSGVNIVYCAEPFSGDGPLTVLVKSIKRAMAAEYSRELSAKVFSAQCKRFAAGQKQGGNPGYGLRRMVFSADGQPKQTLYRGDRKNNQADHVRLVLGPPEEQEVVRQMYAMYLDNGLGDTAIAANLNARKLRNEFGDPWRPTDVKSVLTNSKYCGQLAFAKTSKKLATPSVRNSPECWVRWVAPYDPIVSQKTFLAAQHERARRKTPPTNDELLAGIRAIYDKHGKVTAKLLDAELPRFGWRGLEKRFGSMAEAYIAAGLPSTESISAALTRRGANRKLAILLERVKVCIAAAGGTWSGSGGNAMLTLQNGAKLRVAVASCSHHTTDRPRWRVRLRSGGPTDFLLVGRLDTHNDAILDYFLLRIADHPASHINLSRRRLPDPVERARYETLEPIFGLSKRGK